MSSRRHLADRGSVTLELAVLAPALLLLLAALVLAGRVQTTTSAAEQAAHAAARDASLARTAEAARQAAVATADADLRGSRCTTTDVMVETAGFSATVGTNATVTVTVTCSMTFADLAVPGLPGSHTITARATSPIDRYRAR